MRDFITFEYFITQDILIIFYYIGVFSLPLIIWIYRAKLSFITKMEYSTKSLLVILGLFLLFQLMWRMMFETMIGYFDMHNYLQMLTQKY